MITSSTAFTMSSGEWSRKHYDGMFGRHPFTQKSVPKGTLFLFPYDNCVINLSAARQRNPRLRICRTVVVRVMGYRRTV